MKKELLASVLTLTAGMASTVSFPQTALAKSTIVEKEFAKNFVLKSANKARYTDSEGKVVVGHLYLSIEQSPLTPDSQNQLRGEMTGVFYFESDEATEEYDGVKYTTKIVLAGDDGEVLLDRTHKSRNENRYSLYGCNSTLTYCSPENYELTLAPGKLATMNLQFSANIGIEVEEVWQGGSQWSPYAYNAKMIEITK